MRWQVVIALLATVVVLALTAYTAFNTRTVIVPELAGHYVEGLAGSARAINPILSAYNDVDRDLCALIFNGLTAADEMGQIQPDLAERWQLSDDGLAYTFYLRRDARWHDGVSVTANDVLLTVDLVRSPDFPGPADLSDLWRTVTVERLDDHTVRFSLAEPYAPFLHHTTLGLLPSHILQDVPAGQLMEHAFNLHPVGTGPFLLLELDDQHALLSANDDYYAGRPYLDTMEFRFYPDWLGALTAYERGEVQGIAKIPLDLVDEAVRETSLVLHHAPLSSYGLVFLNLRRSVFQDRAVRQALMWALDREGLIEHALKGQAIVADGPVPPFSWAYEPHTTQYSFRPTMARRLLDESGWTDEDGDGVREKDGAPLQFELVTNEDATRVSVVQELARQWADVGVRVVTATAGLAGIVREYLVPRDYDAVFYDFQRLPTDPDPYALWHSTQVAEGGQNYAGYGSEQADVLMEEARRTSYKDSRASLYRELQAILADDLPTLPLYFSVYTYVLDRAVQAVQLAPMWEPSDRFRTIQDWHMGKHRSTVSEAPFLTRPTSESP